jgi:hypothetical protein
MIRGVREVELSRVIHRPDPMSIQDLVVLALHAANSLLPPVGTEGGRAKEDWNENLDFYHKTVIIMSESSNGSWIS